MSRIPMHSCGHNRGVALLIALAVAASGLHGTVMRGPTRPVCRVDQPCSAPAAHVRLVFARHGRVAARVRTDAAGGYSVRLQPGTYVVSLAAQPPIGRGLEPARVNVVDGSARRVDFFIDTGIR
jgi:hypothetical protein